MAESFNPPAGVVANAKRGLELRREFNRGGTEVGVARARSLSNGQGIPLETIRRMVSYFARHEVDKKGKDWGNASNPSAGYIAWLLWGGDAGKTWADSISEREKKKDKSMATDMTSTYAAIIKQEKQEDGTLLVYGKATDDSLDIDQQICDAAWLEKAMPEWFKTGGNIREQHSSIAAGVAKELNSTSDGHYISALVVDPVSVKKVETGVLKGFSIGIRAPRVVRDNKAANGRIIDGQIVEVSLVDRPANPNAKLMLAKSNGTEVVQMEQFIEKQEEETPVATTEPTEVIEAEVVEAETAAVEAEEAKADMPSKEDALKALEELRENLMAHEKMCKELGYLEDEEEEKELKPVGESAEEETEEGSEAGAAEEEVEEAEGKKPVPNKSAEGENAEETKENSVEETEQPALDDDVIDAIVDKAVKSATATVRDEIKSYKEEINKLQAELATAKNKAVGSGPKRAVVSKPAILEFNEFSRIAEQYRAKAAETSDNELARGYRELAADFEAKAVALINN
jgi:hypothetical protein